MSLALSVMVAVAVVAVVVAAVDVGVVLVGGCRGCGCFCCVRSSLVACWTLTVVGWLLVAPCLLLVAHPSGITIIVPA